MVWHDAVFEIREFPADRGIVVVLLQAKLPRAVDVGIVDLDLVSLGMDTRCEERCDRPDGRASGGICCGDSAS
jgi:hypothetical protein